jgi:cytochrome d ubiquinol oxidase subunit II
LWGVAFANIVHGVPIDANKEFTGNLFTLLNPFGLLGGLVTLGLFLTHGAMFTALKTTGGIRQRARNLSVKIGLASAVVAVVFLIWTQLDTGTVGSAVAFVVAALALVGGIVMARAGREGWAFAGTSLTIALAVAGLFMALFPDVMPSSTDPAYSLTTTNAAATHYTLTVMTWVAVVFTPIVLAYQGWTYWVFRKRVGTQHIPQPEARAA